MLFRLRSLGQADSRSAVQCKLQLSFSLLSRGAGLLFSHTEPALSCPGASASSKALQKLGDELIKETSRDLDAKAAAVFSYRRDL